MTVFDNLGASTALIGVYFVADLAYDFSDRALLLVGLLQGITYIIAALSAGALVRRIAGPNRRLSTRAMLGWLHVILTAVCTLPIVWKSPASIWIVVGVYSALTGVLWPVVESFLSAGRQGAELRTSSAFFNMSWAGCQVVTFWIIAPFMQDAATSLWTIPVMGLSHLLSIPLLTRFQREPAPHGESHQAHAPAERARAERLLHAHRAMLILSYVAYSTINPLLPSILRDRLELDSVWATPLTSVWMFTRVLMFLALGLWGGWQGRFRTILWPALLLISGLSIALFASSAAMLALGLAVFGLGMGAVYATAFFYAMDVGSSGVDAGGKHEALIGVGYMGGPIIGSTAAALAQGGVIEPNGVPGVTIALFSVAFFATGLIVARSVAPFLRGARQAEHAPER